MKHFVLAAMMTLFGTTAFAQNLSYGGWEGSVDILPGGTAGCHLDSPDPTRNYTSRIRVVAEFPQTFYIVFNSDTMRWAPNTVHEVELSVGSRYWYETTADKSRDPAEAESPQKYRIRVLNAYPKFDRLMLEVNADDPFLQKIRNAIELRIWFLDITTVNFPEVIDLRHFSLDAPSTWMNVINTNDTYGAIQTVLDCVRKRH